MDWLKLFPFVRTVWNWFRSRIGLSREHDIAIFKKIDAIANEQRIDDILNFHIFTSDHKIEYDHLLQDFIDALLRIENQYIDTVIKVINLRARELAWEMQDFLAFDAEWKTLNEKLEKAWQAYKAYRLSVKERLMV